MNTSNDSEPIIQSSTAAVAHSQPSLPPASGFDPQLSATNPHQTFARVLGETPRAFNAFTTFYLLGHDRSLQGVAEKLGEQLPTVKNWSSKFDWSERILQFESGVLQKQIEAETEARRKAAADWAQRNADYREQEWVAAQKLLNVVQCCLENFGERDLERMRLSELSRALNIASKMSRSALRAPETDNEKPAMSQIQLEMTAALKRIYGHSASQSPKSEHSNTTPPTNSSQPYTQN